MRPFVFVLTWWYVVIHPQVAEDTAPEGLEQLGAPAVEQLGAPAEQLGTPEAAAGPATGFYVAFGILAVLAAVTLVRGHLPVQLKIDLVQLLMATLSWPRPEATSPARR